MPRIGPHIDPPLSRIPSLLAAHGWATFQTTLRDPHRLSKESIPDEGDQALFLMVEVGRILLWVDACHDSANAIRDFPDDES